jgi:hypothetical protein
MKVPVESLRVAVAAGIGWVVMGEVHGKSRPIKRCESEDEAKEFIAEKLLEELTDGDGCE